MWTKSLDCFAGAILLKNNGFLFESYEKKRTHENYVKALSAISLFRKQEPEAFARVFFRAPSIVELFLPSSGPAPLPRNRLQEIEEEIKREQEQNVYEAKKNSSDKGGK